MDTQNQPTGSKSNKKLAIIVVIIIVLALGAWYFLKGNTATTDETTGEETTPTEEAQAVNDELNGIDTGDTNQELESIDKDLESL